MELCFLTWWQLYKVQEKNTFSDCHLGFLRYPAEVLYSRAILPSYCWLFNIIISIPSPLPSGLILAALNISQGFKEQLLLSSNGNVILFDPRKASISSGDCNDQFMCLVVFSEQLTASFTFQNFNTAVLKLRHNHSFMTQI